MIPAISLVFTSSIIAVIFSLCLIIWLFKRDRGTARMREISSYIQEGAKSYLYQQYKVVGLVFLIILLALLFMSFQGLLDKFVPWAFISGGIFSALCGWVGMTVSTHSNASTAFAAKKGIHHGLKTAFSAGTVMGLMVVGLGLFYLVAWFVFLRWWYASYPLPAGIDDISVAITSTMLCFGMGASCYALFARVGGGIYTKAADVGADLVGKVEIGIPEDDPRNPAVIADQVGDNVGDVAGMGADLFESYIDSLVAAMALAASAALGIKGVILPMLIAAVGIIASILGFFLVSTKKEGAKDLLHALRRGVFSAAFIVLAASLGVINYLFDLSYWGMWVAIVFGIMAGIVLGVCTEYFTSATYPPTKELAHSASTGPATVIISGISLGMMSTLLPVIIICVTVLLSFLIAGGYHNYNLGLYGIGIASVGLLSTLGITLASDAYGPVADNAGGIAEMSDLDQHVRKRTDKLDSLGNTTAATGKGFAIGSAALTTLALIVAYKERVELFGSPLNLSILNVKLLIGLFLGAVMPFLFCSLTIRAVGRAAESIVKEVRRQFKQIKGLLEGESKADYAACVKITTREAQKSMTLPTLSAIIMPVLTGILMGAEAVAGLLVGALICGFVLAIMMANSGGAWDNAKKYIESGHLKGKGSDAHKAAVVGDTVGDPFKDTAGPSLNILLKLMSMVAIVFSQLIIAHAVFK